ncbi:unnamed protein product [Amoebophrya sp. A120]|nr:unnamed protein product [Amoebophrya sp. A120]|eukprot:GSA120T00019720001.1
MVAFLKKKMLGSMLGPCMILFSAGASRFALAAAPGAAPSGGGHDIFAVTGIEDRGALEVVGRRRPAPAAGEDGGRPTRFLRRTVPDQHASSGSSFLCDRKVRTYVYLFNTTVCI